MFHAYAERFDVTRNFENFLVLTSFFLSFGSFKVKDGMHTRFWVDIWLGSQPLRDKFLELFNIMRIKQYSVAKILSSILLNISFCWNLVGRNLRD